MAVLLLLVAGALIWTVLRQRSGDGGAASSPVATRPEMVQGEPRAIGLHNCLGSSGCYRMNDTVMLPARASG